jgi:TolA-binding protein
MRFVLFASLGPLSLPVLGSLLVAGLAPAAALAQELDPVRVEKRVGKLESEMRAVQRKVFPGGDPRYFEPEITAPAAAPAAAIGNPASAPLIDLTARVGELERQLREMTGAIEANQFKLRQLEEAQAKLRGDIEFRLNALEGGSAAGAAIAAGATAAAVLPTPSPSPSPTPSSRPAGKPAATVATTADAAWKAAYANVTAKNWPATQAAMAEFVAAWPRSTRLPQAQFWLGRSHAERAQHAEAARAFLELYKTAPRSPQAADSLIGLAGAMNGLKKPRDSCRVLGELDSVYGAKLTAAQVAEARLLRTRAKCEA